MTVLLSCSPLVNVLAVSSFRGFPHILTQPTRMRPEHLHGAETSHVSDLRFYVALGSLIWWVIVWSVCAIGFTQLYTTPST